MTARYLTRIDPDANMARYYKLDVLPDLFGSFSLIREFGRIGRSGRIMAATYETASAAERLAIGSLVRNSNAVTRRIIGERQMENRFKERLLENADYIDFLEAYGRD